MNDCLCYDASCYPCTACDGCPDLAAAEDEAERWHAAERADSAADRRRRLRQAQRRKPLPEREYEVLQHANRLDHLLPPMLRERISLRHAADLRALLPDTLHCRYCGRSLPVKHKGWYCSTNACNNDRARGIHR